MRTGYKGLLIVLLGIVTLPCMAPAEEWYNNGCNGEGNTQAQARNKMDECVAKMRDHPETVAFKVTKVRCYANQYTDKYYCHADVKLKDNGKGPFGNGGGRW